MSENPESEKPRSRKKEILILGSIVVVAAVVLAIVGWMLGDKGAIGTGDEKGFVNPQEMPQTDPNAPPPEVIKDRPLSIVVVPVCLASPFSQGIHVGAKKAAQDLPKLRVSWSGPSDLKDKNAQSSIMSTFVHWYEVEGIVLEPADPNAPVGQVKNAVSRKVSVVVVGSPLSGGGFVSYVEADQHSAGALAAEHVAKLLGYEGNVLVLRSQKDAADTTAREKGFADTLAKHADVKIVSQDQYAGGDEKKAQSLCTELLKKFPKLDAVFCSGEAGALGMLAALQAAKRAGAVKLVACDPHPALVKALKDGQVHGLALGNSVQLGYLGVKACSMHLRGNKVEPKISVEAVLVTKENMDQPELKHVHSPDVRALSKKQ